MTEICPEVHANEIHELYDKVSPNLNSHKNTHTCNSVNPLSPNSDQHQISPGKINVYPIPEVMRIKDTITQDEFS